MSRKTINLVTVLAVLTANVDSADSMSSALGIPEDVDHEKVVSSMVDKLAEYHDNIPEGKSINKGEMWKIVIEEAIENANSDGELMLYLGAGIESINRNLVMQERPNPMAMLLHSMMREEA